MAKRFAFNEVTLETRKIVTPIQMDPDEVFQLQMGTGWHSYHLYAVVHHLPGDLSGAGTNPHSGHYVTMIKKGSHWYRFDDWSDASKSSHDPTIVSKDLYYKNISSGSTPYIYLFKEVTEDSASTI
jgi:ubiquitin C-terminal hydrolase